MSFLNHDADCTKFEDLRGKCEQCTVDFLEWQADGLERILNALAEEPEEE